MAQGGFQVADHLFKVVLIGDSGVGKTSLVQRARGMAHSNTSATVGVAFDSIVMERNGRNVKLCIWDTSGEERFRSVAPTYYRGAHIVVVAYDVTSKDSFKNTSTWLSEAFQTLPEGVCVMLVGNKSDLTESRVVTTDEGEALARRHNAEFVETSAATNHRVSEAFERAADQCIERLQLPSIPKRTLNLTEPRLVKPSGAWYSKCWF